MFEPKYTISHKLLANIKRIAGLTEALNAGRISEPVLMELETRAREVSSYSSTSIEGNPLPLTEVKRILKARPDSLRDSEREVLNYNQALIKLNKLVLAGKIGVSLKSILEIQKNITSGLIAKHACGKIRLEPVFVNDPRSGKPVYLPPDYQEVETLLSDLIDYTRKNKAKFDPLIIAGIFHKQFVAIHPFIDGNGRTARLATKMLLAGMGLNTFNLFSFENYYNKNVSKYFQKVGVFGDYYEIKENVDFTDWLEYFTEGIIDELLRVRKELSAAGADPGRTLKEYHNKLLEYIEDYGYVTDKDYSKLTERAKATRSLDFKKLMALGYIEKFGKGKSTHYKLKA